MKNFITGFELSPSEIKQIISQGILLKKSSPQKILSDPKIMTALFANPSLRTRLSFESGMKKMGGSCNVMDLKSGYEWEYEFGKIMNGETAEHIKEAAQVVSRYSDIIGLRNSSLITRSSETAAIKSNYETYKSDHVIQAFSKYATVPVINMESNMHHPCQGLADGMTITEIQKKQNLSKTKFVLSWVPHPKALPLATPHSQMIFPALIGCEVTLCCPPEFVLDSDVMTQTENISGNKITISHDQEEAFQDADIITAKSWASSLNFGEWEAEKKVREKYIEWTIDETKMNLTNQAKFLHCLPMRRNVIATDSVIDDPSSCIIDQAENRMWAQMALIHFLLNQ